PRFKREVVYSNIYIPQKFFAVADYLNLHSEPFSNIYVPSYVGVFLPAYTYNKVYVGHPLATFDYKDKIKITEKFYLGEMSKEEARSLLVAHKIMYVYTDQQRLLDNYRDFLKPVFS